MVIIVENISSKRFISIRCKYIYKYMIYMIRMLYMIYSNCQFGHLHFKLVSVLPLYLL